LHKPIFSDIKKRRKPIKKQGKNQGKNPEVRKAKMLRKDASTEPGSQNPKYDNT
jgi:hypothetical protein